MIKNILLFERYDGVRFVIEKSFTKLRERIVIQSSNIKHEIKDLLNETKPDLLITELSKENRDGLELTRYAREIDPDLQIIWISVCCCQEFRKERKNLGVSYCFEKPLEIAHFRRKVLNALDLNKAT